MKPQVNHASFNFTRNFNPSQPGHAPGHLRDALLAALDGPNPWWQSLDIDLSNETQQSKWDSMFPEQRARWLIGQLWNCDDVLPGEVRSEMSDNFDVSVGTYAALVRLLIKELALGNGAAIESPLELS